MIEVQEFLVRRTDVGHGEFARRLKLVHNKFGPRFAELGATRHLVSTTTCRVRSAAITSLGGDSEWPFDAMVAIGWPNLETYDAALGHVATLNLLDELKAEQRAFADQTRSRVRVTVTEAILPAMPAAGLTPGLKGELLNEAMPADLNFASPAG